MGKTITMGEIMDFDDTLQLLELLDELNERLCLQTIDEAIAIVQDHLTGEEVADQAEDVKELETPILLERAEEICKSMEKVWSPKVLKLLKDARSL